jgi:hypothetical protein
VTQEIVKSENLFLVKVSLIDVLKDPDYYIKAIKKIERLRNEEIYKRENDFNTTKKPEILKTEFELLQEAPTKEYLRRTILPLLNNALSIIEIERP